MSRASLIRLLASVVALLLVVPAVWATQGSFRGTVVQVPEGQPTAGFLYLQSKKGGIRKVEISKAEVVFDENARKDLAAGSPKDRLKPGAEVRVTAEQAQDGEWHASRIEIVTDETSVGSDIAKPENGMQPANSDDDGSIPYAPDAMLGQGSIRRI